MTEIRRFPDAESAPAADGSRVGRRRFIQGVGALAGASILSSLLAEGAAHGAVVPSRFIGLESAVRVADTRAPGEHDVTRLASNRIRIPVAGRHGVSADASALVVTIAGLNRDEPNWVVALPSGGAIPVAANLNLRDPQEVNANLVTVKVGADGAIDVASRVPCDVVVDVLGYYEPVDGAVREGRFVSLPSSRRALDTREIGAKTTAGGFTTVDVTALVPSDASAVVINLTATETAGSGYYTAVSPATTTIPTTSNLNVRGVGNTRGAAVIVPIATTGGRRRFEIYSKASAHLVVDVSGYYTGPSSALSQSGLFVPLSPIRILDTRLPGQIGRLWPRWVVEATLPGAAATGSAIVCNVTGVESRGPGHFRVSGARQPVPGTANVNWAKAGAYVPNHVMTPITAVHGIQIYSSHGAHAIVDLAGYFTGAPKTAAHPKYANPAPPAIGPPWTLHIPRIGLTSAVLSGNSRQVTDAGHSWHWAGTGAMGEVANVAAFAHRTEAGGPYRYLHLLQVGDTFTITTGDRREYTYRMVRRDLTDAANGNILDAVRAHPGTTFSMVACTVGYDSSKSAYPDIWAPTSLLYRIVVTGELISWREI